MLTVVASAAIGRSCSAGNKADFESGAVVVGEYSIIELRIQVAIFKVLSMEYKASLQSDIK